MKLLTLKFCRIDGTFLPWSIDLGKHLLSSYPLPEGLTPIPSEVPLPHKITLEILDDPDPSDSTSGGIPKLSKMGLDQTEENPPKVTTTLTGNLAGPRATILYTPPEDPEPPAPCEQLKDHLPGVDPPIESKFPPADRIEIPDPTEVRLVGNKRLTPDTHWQDVRELTFVMSDEFEYLPGETMTIYPKNFPEDVQALIDLMDWNEVADRPLRLQPEYPDLYLDEYLVPTAPGLYPLPRTTLRQLLIHNLDITAIPKRHFFELIAHHTNDPMHKERLLEFTNPAFTDEFYDYATRPRRSILEVLQEFSSVKIPWKWATSFFPVIRGRAYSVASGGTLLDYPYEPHVIKVQLIVALVKYRTVLKKVRQGLCSRYLASLPVGTELHVKFTIPEKFYERAKDVPQLPLILVAPGTGVAPCRALLWDRAQLHFENKHTIGKAYLFYGGRNKDADFFYKDDWRYLQTEVFTAFSRDQKEKIYVQDIIRREGKLLEHLIRKEAAIIYVCGSSGNMPKAVKEALIDVCHKFNSDGRSREAIENGFDKLDKNGHYIQETW
jgi:sulfite reductase alpha subunit-like flavoprotein